MRASRNSSAPYDPLRPNVTTSNCNRGPAAGDVTNCWRSPIRSPRPTSISERLRTRDHARSCRRATATREDAGHGNQAAIAARATSYGTLRSCSPGVRERSSHRARNTRLRRDRQPRPRPEQIHRPRGHGELPAPFRPHLLCLRHGAHPLHRPRRHRLPRREEIRRADRLDATAPGPRPTPNVCLQGRASASRCTPRP